MRNVLVFPAGTEIGLEIERALRNIAHFQGIGATSLPDHSAFAYPLMSAQLPMFSDPKFVPALVDVLVRHDIDFLFPAHDDLVELLPRLQAEGRLPAHVSVVGSSRETAALARSKRATYERLKDIVATPQIFSPAEVTAADLPLFLKPDRGQGSKGARKVVALADARNSDDSSVLSEYLPGEEFTIDCFTDRTGRLRFAGGRRRRRISNGISVASELVEDPAFFEMAKAINAAIDLRGMWFFQVKKRSCGTPVLMEFAPRVSGGMGFFRARGVNLPALALYDLMDKDVDIFWNDIEVIRDSALAPAYEVDLNFAVIYVDLDDTLIFAERTNAALVGQLYHWKNQGKALHLITRHREVHGHDPRSTLLRHRISPDLFDEIIEVHKGQRKSARIAHKSAIFIDDSTAERRDVHDTCAIPTFTCTQACEVFARSKGNFA